jgi:hypothetical protein
MNRKRASVSIHIRPRRRRYRKSSVNSSRKPILVVDPRKIGAFLRKKQKAKSKMGERRIGNRIYKML